MGQMRQGKTLSAGSGSLRVTGRRLVLPRPSLPAADRGRRPPSSAVFFLGFRVAAVPHE